MNTSDVTAAQRRENPDPHEVANPIPWFVVILVGCLAALCIVYIVEANVDTPSEWGDSRSAAELAGKRPTAGAKVDGAALFASACVACHQTTGAGLHGVFPPLAGSEWVNGKETTMAAIVLHGISGEITVKGSSYAGTMPAFKDQFSDEQLAAVLTHVRAQWGNAAAPVAASTVATVREQMKARTAPFSGGKELGALP
ncbi:MAG: cytochrome c [Burkholderiales bacterium]